jgi:hypothetical protein
MSGGKNKGNNKITEHPAIFQKERQNSQVNKQKNQSTIGKLENRNGTDLAQTFPRKWWVESDYTAPNLPLP